MKRPTHLLLLSIVCINGLAGCGYVRSLFPDKEKDYQYTTEIPPLIYPKDLASGDFPKPIATHPADAQLAHTSVELLEKTHNISSQTRAQTIQDQSAILPTPDNSAVTQTPVESVSTTQTPRHMPVITNVVTEGGLALLRVDSDSDTAWRAVNKAISRKSIEVIDRNTKDQVITLQFDDTNQKVQDNSLWDEALFIFSGLTSTDKQYQLKFSKHGSQTDVSIYDDAQQPIADNASLNLLKLLQDTIKSDFVK